MAPGRSRDAVGRRAAILDAARGCFTSKGYEATALSEVSRRSRASIGSIYHHFGSKEHLAAAVFLAGVVDYQRGFLETLHGARGAAGGIRGAVQHHLRWVGENRQLAAFLLEEGSSVRHARPGVELRERHAQFAEEALAWLRPHVEAQRVRHLSPDLYYVLWIGPSQEFTRNWLAGATRTSLEVAGAELADAAWVALRERRG